MKKLALLLVAVCAVFASASAQMSIKLNSGSSKWGYNNPFVALVQEWDGSAFDIETRIHFPKSGKPGHLPRESVYGFYVQDTKRKHRYCPGIVNHGQWNHKLNPLPLGVTKHEAGGHWKPFPLKGHSVAKSASPVRLRLQFIPAAKGAKNSTLIFSYAPKGKEWTEAWRYDAPANFKPNLIGLTADSYRGKYSFDPVVFDYFHVKGKGPAISDEFDGTGKKQQWQKLSTKRAEFLMPVKFEAVFTSGQFTDSFVFNSEPKSRQVKMTMHSTMLAGRTVSLKATVVNGKQQVLHTEQKKIKYAKDIKPVNFTLPVKVMKHEGLYYLNVEAYAGDDKLARFTLPVAVVDSKTSYVPDVRALGVKGDGKTDDTSMVQALLQKGFSELYFPEGVYLLGTLKVPGDTTIRFGPKAKYKINPAKVKVGPIAAKRKGKRVIVLGGDNIILDGLNFDFIAPNGKELDVKAIQVLIYGDGISNLRVTRLRAVKKVFELKRMGSRMGGGIRVVHLLNSRDIEVDRCEVANIGMLVRTKFCKNVSVHENRAEWCGNITHFRYGSGLRHYANWSSNVTFQCVWWGGNADSRRAGLPLLSAKIVNRDIDVLNIDLKPGDQNNYAEYGEFRVKLNNVGAYDISVQNNYAEYGECGFWGAKSRNVLISGNIARFMTDMSYDVEGDGNVIFANNISVNANIAGIGCYFYSSKVLITGNVILVLDEGDDKYKGMFVRLHSGGSRNTYSGVGKAIISGNLFVSEVRKKRVGTLNRMIQIEDCRDVTISGNKFINGWIRTLPWCTSNKVTIINNEFDNRIAGNGPAIRIDSKGTEAIIRNNIIRKIAAENNPAFKDAAIHILAAPKKRIIIDGNIIEGWGKSISCKPKNKGGDRARFIIKNNMVSGTINLLGIKALFKKYVKDNLNLKSFRTVKEKQILEKDFKNEKYK